MAAPWQGLPVRLERAPHRGAAFALSNASKRARTRSIGSRSRGSLFIFRSSPAVAPPSSNLVGCRYPSTARGRVLRAGLKDQRRDLLGAVDADPGAEQPAARAVATRLVRCQSGTLAHHASPLASGAAAAAFMMRPTTMPSASTS